MNYTITEHEFQALDAVRGQLNLVAGLLTAKGADANLYDTSDLYDFLATQADTIKSLLKAFDQRYDLSQDENNSLSMIDWHNMLQVVSGRRAMPNRDLKMLGKKLQNSTMVDPDMNYVLKLWKDLMTNGGEWPFSLEPSSTDGFNIRFPERVAEMVEPASEPKTKPNKAAPRKRDRLAMA
jgi:hypothetical protein